MHEEHGVLGSIFVAGCFERMKRRVNYVKVHMLVMYGKRPHRFKFISVDGLKDCLK